MKRMFCWGGCVLMSAGLASAATFWAATGAGGADGVLYSVETSPFSVTPVGDITVGGEPVALTGLAVHPQTGVLYGVTANASPNDPRSLVSVDTITGAATVLGELGDAPAVDISFNAAGTLFGWFGRSDASGATVFDAHDLGIINLANGAVTMLEDTAENTTSGGGLAFSPTGELYLSRDRANGVLQLVDPATGELDDGPILSGAPFPNNTIGAMAFDSEGVLYGVNLDQGVPAVSRLVTINPNTGAVSLVGDLPNNMDALALATPVPEPAAASVVCGLFVLGFAAWRRFRA